VIDLHCHLLPGIDDGPKELSTSLEMARIAVDDGISKIYCTPHIYPGMYENVGADIIARVEALRKTLAEQNIPLALSYGADAHLVPELHDGIKTGRVPTLGGSRYVLVEPSHHVCPPRFRESVFQLVADGYVPIITHPERLSYVAEHYDDFVAIAQSGGWLQITGGALLGKFGKLAQRYSERFLDEGWVAVIATDAHTTQRRAPLLAEAERRAAMLVGAEEASKMVRDRPRAVCDNRVLNEVPPILANLHNEKPRQESRWSLSRWFARRQ
jgi:protein-tyrosine phosphatase